MFVQEMVVADAQKPKGKSDETGRIRDIHFMKCLLCACENSDRDQLAQHSEVKKVKFVLKINKKLAASYTSLKVIFLVN